jgi:hypothetical protein
MDEERGERTGIAEVRAALDAAERALSGLDLLTASADELRGLAAEAERHRTRVAHARLRLYAELTARGEPQRLAVRGLPELIRLDTRCGWKAAQDLDDAVGRFASRRTLTGEPLPPLFGRLADDLAKGTLPLPHATVIAKAIERLPEPLRSEHSEQIQRVLLAQASDVDPRGLAMLAQRVLDHLWPDGPPPTDPAQHVRRRALRIAPNADGSGELRGHLSPECRAIWEVILASLAELRGEPNWDAPPAAAVPASADAGLHADGDGDGDGDGEPPLPVGTPNPDQLGPDPRSDAQVAHDAFEEAGRRLLNAGGLPEHAGLPATLLITMTLRDLESRAGRATTHTGGSLTIAEALRLAADEGCLPVVLAGDPDDPRQPGGAVLHHGRAKRLATAGQRRALFARDRGCSFPGCDKSPSQSQIHHAPEWTKNGQTNVDTMTVTCGYHNNEAPRQGWETLMIKGIPHWRPPRWLDAERRPRRNYLNHPELLLPRAPATNTPSGAQP